MSRTRGRPVVGAISGLLLGLLVSLDLVLLGVLPTNAQVLLLFPPLGLVLGIVMGRAAPLARLRRRKEPDDKAGSPAEPEPQPAPEPVAGGEA